MARNFSDMVDDAIRKKIASFKVGYGDEWVKEFVEWAEQDVELQPAQQDGSVTIKMAGRSILQGDVFMDAQPAQPTRRLVKRWAICSFDELENSPVYLATIWPDSAENPIVMFRNPYDTLAAAESALLEWGKRIGDHAKGDYVIMPVYRVETDSK